MSEQPNDLFGTISIDSSPEDETKPQEKTVRSSRKKKKKGTIPKDARKKPSMGAGAKLFIALICATAVYSLFGFFGVPYGVQFLLPDYLADKLQINLRVGTAAFNPFSFRLSVQDVIGETNEPGEDVDQLLTVGEAAVDFDLLPLLRGELVCSTMDIDRMNVKILRRNDKNYNFSYLLKNKTVRSHSDIIDFAELPFLFSLNNIKFSNSQVIFDDKVTGKVHHIDRIELSLPAISNFQYHTDTYIHPQFSAVVNGSPVKLSGDAALGALQEDGRQTQLSCDLNEINIPLYFDYLPVTLPVDVTEGTANGTLQVSFSPEEEKGSKLKIGFSVTASGLTVESRNSQLNISVPTAKFDGSFEPFSHSLDIQNLLLREPSLSSNGVITRDTMANLAPLVQRPGADDPLHQVIPNISVKLLIADGGSIVIRKKDEKEPVRIWHSLQLSIKNFTNAPTSPDQEDATFRLSGEHLASSAFFTWQGQFNKQNHPSGNLQLNSMPASVVAPFLAKNSKDIKGTADLTGLLSLSLSEDENKPFDYTLKSSKLAIKDLHLSDDGVEWINIPDFRCEPVSIIKNVTDLGNVYMKNSFVTIYRDRPPHILKSFTIRPASHIVHGLDFSGVIQIKEESKKSPIIKFQNVVLQANKLEQQQIDKENFVFSAAIGDQGKLKTKGTLHTAPFEVVAQLAFTGLTPENVFQWFSNSSTLRDSRGAISAKGTFLYPQKEFQGHIETEDIIIGNVQKPVFRAAKAKLDDFFWSQNAQKLSVKYLLVDEPEFSWNRSGDKDNPIVPASVFFRHIFLPEPDSASSDPDTSTAHFSLNVERIDFADGAASYQDLRITPPLALGITGINGSISKLEYPVARGPSEIKINGHIEGQPFTIEGEGKIMQDPPSSEFTFSSLSLPLSLFARQLGSRTGNLDFGNANAQVTAKYRISGAEKKSQASIVLTGIAPRKGGTPESTALAMMSDASGQIALEVEAKEDAIYEPILSGAATNFSTSIIKAAINPMLLAGDRFADLISSQFITFIPGTDTISGEGIERMNRFSEFLALYPMTKLILSSYAGRNDGKVLAEQLEAQEQKKLDEINRKRLAEWQQKKAEEDKRLLEETTANPQQIKESDILRPKLEPFVPLLPKPVKVTDATLNELAAKRLQKVLDHFILELSVPADRLGQKSPTAGRISEETDSGRVEIELSDLY